MKLYRFNGQSSVLAALLLSGVLLAGCGQEEEADGTAVPETAVPETTTQDQQNSEVADGASTQDDQFVSEQESAQNAPAMDSEAGMASESGAGGESTNEEPAQEGQPLAGDATEEPGFGDGTDPMPGDSEDASDLSANGPASRNSDEEGQPENADSKEEDSSSP